MSCKLRGPDTFAIPNPLCSTSLVINVTRMIILIIFSYTNLNFIFPEWETITRNSNRERVSQATLPPPESKMLLSL